MTTRSRILFAALLGALLLFTGIAFAAASDTPQPAAPSPAATASPTATDSPEDISGNCDEAEHAADPECTNVAPAAAAFPTPTNTPSHDRRGDRDHDDEDHDDNGGQGRGRGRGRGGE